jgi:deferrochelatase/peroxidase EfeB
VAGFTRRRALLAGGGALGLATAGGAGFAVGDSAASGDEPSGDEVVAFEGVHQAGVATPAQARLVFGAFDLTADRPAGLRALPALAGDELDPARTGGDLCVQACADDPQVAFHAVRNLLRVGRGMAELRWMQLGFGSNTATTTDEATPRNLMGFKDGTRNLRVDDDASMDRFVWVGSDR